MSPGGSPRSGRQRRGQGSAWSSTPGSTPISTAGPRPPPASWPGLAATSTPARTAADEGELHRVCNQNGIRKDTGLEFREFVRTMLEIGCLGRVVDAKSTSRYVVGEFEYTRAGSLHVGADELFCIHPVFAEAFDGRHATGRRGQLAASERRTIRPVYPIGSDPNDPHDYRDALPTW